MHGEPIPERAFRVLDAFTEAGVSLALHTIAAQAGLPESTPSRTAARLTDLGALERLENGDFVVGLQLLEIASLAPSGHGLCAALPFRQELHRVTGQRIFLVVRDGDEAVLVERLSARDAAAVKYRGGGPLPLTGTDTGIALLAHVPERIRKEALAGANDAACVRRLLATVRSDGVCAVRMPRPTTLRPHRPCRPSPPRSCTVTATHGARCRWSHSTRADPVPRL
ncbi:hypothetical protein SALBM135S_05575 [Streptomyces alboniger]